LVLFYIVQVRHTVLLQDVLGFEGPFDDLIFLLHIMVFALYNLTKHLIPVFALVAEPYFETAASFLSYM
jgi:hypothetical protein